jgi:predicted AAA+ superfamily ATPase
MDRAYRSIIDNIARIYERYEHEASSKNDEKRKKGGDRQPDKDETRFFDIVGDLIKPLSTPESYCRGSW